MTHILHVACSPRGRASESDRLARRIIGHLMQRDPSATVAERNLASEPMPHVDADYALSQQASADVSQSGSAALSDVLIAELERADAVVIGTPVHNFTVPSALKAWIDHVVRVRCTFELSPHGKIGTLRDRPVYVAASSGGFHSGERARHPDFLTPYLATVLGLIGLRDLAFFSVQGTAFGADAVAAARARTDEVLQAHFDSPRT